MTPPKIDTDIQICLQLLHVWSRIKANIVQFATENNLTIQQIFALYHLHATDHILMGTLAKQLHCDASNVTSMVDRLQSLGLLSRVEMPEDRRAKQLAITPVGKRLIDRLIVLLPAGLGLEKLPATDRDSLHSILGQLSSD